MIERKEQARIFRFNAFEFEVVTDNAGNLIECEVRVDEMEMGCQQLDRVTLSAFAAWLENVQATVWDDEGTGKRADEEDE